MRLYVVSDLHIRGERDPAFQALVGLMRVRCQPGDRLVLAGDIFDLFVGSKEVYLRRYQAFLEALREAGERGVLIHYIEGNHDFLIRGAMGSIPGVEVHGHEVTLELGGKKIFVAHGDTVDQEDWAYRALRVFFRSPLMKAFVGAVPGGWLDAIGHRASRVSRGERPKIMADLPLDQAERLRRKFRSYAAEQISRGFDFVVLGHCHDLDEMRFKVGEREGQYLNVGFPPVHGSLISWQSGDALMGREAL